MWNGNWCGMVRMQVQESGRFKAWSLINYLLAHDLGQVTYFFNFSYKMGC